MSTNTISTTQVFELGKQWLKSTIGIGTYKTSVVLYDRYHAALGKLSAADRTKVEAEVLAIDKVNLSHYK